MNTPIALFCFRRPDHLARTLAALAANEGAPGHDLVAFSDGPRRPGDHDGVDGVRALLEEWRGRGAFRSFTIDAQPANLGLRRSVVRGVGRLCDEAGSVIVVEDDLVTSPHFLRYCEDGLRTYRDDEAVASIHGYSYPVKERLPETFFLRGADCWGWATWRRAWKNYDDDAERLLKQIAEAGLIQRFNFAGAFSFYQMLADARDGRVDSWAVRWHASAFLACMYTLYPGRSLVHNIGLDHSGTHCGRGVGFAGSLAAGSIHVERLPIAEDLHAWAAFARHFPSLKPSLRTRIRSRLGRLLGWA